MQRGNEDATIYLASEDGLIAIIGYAVSSPRYVAGFADITLLHGNVSVNGYAMKVDETVPTRSTGWSPAVQLTISASIKATKSSIPPTKTKKFKGMLCKVCDDSILVNKFFESEVNARFAACQAVVVAQGLSYEKQEWLMVAEGMDARLQPWQGRMQRRQLMQTNFVCVGSALLADGLFMQQQGLDVTHIPPSWRDGAADHVAAVAARCSSSSSAGSAAQPGGASPLPSASAASPRSVVCGAKGVGKSTLLRHLANNYLSCGLGYSAVAVIDCDVGQPEFGIPGIMSLHIVTAAVCSTPHLHLREFPPELAFFLGEISTKHYPERFSAALQLLVEKYGALRAEVETGRRVYHRRRSGQGRAEETGDALSKPSGGGGNNMFALLNDDASYSTSPAASSASVEARGLPLLVNCDGNIRFMGSEILGAVVGVVSPTAVFHLSTDKDRILPAIHYSEEHFQLHLAGAGTDGSGNGSGQESSMYPFELYTLEPGRTVQSRVAAVDLRNLRLAAYFLPGGTDDCSGAAAGYDVKAAMRRAAVAQIQAQAALGAADVESLAQCASFPSSGSLDAYTTPAMRVGSVDSDLDRMGADEEARAGIEDGREGAAGARGAPAVSIKNGSLIDPQGVVAAGMLALPTLSVPLSAVSLRSAVTDIPPRLMLAAMNASVVGILANDPDTNPPCTVRLAQRRGVEGHSAAAPVAPGADCGAFSVDCAARFVLQPCVGVGIVRGVSLERQRLFLTAPCAPYLLSGGGQQVGSFGNTDFTQTSSKGRKRAGTEVNRHHAGPNNTLNPNCCLVKGSLALPIGMLFATDFPVNTYCSSDVSGEGAGAMKHRNNVKRKRQS